MAAPADMRKDSHLIETLKKLICVNCLPITSQILYTGILVCASGVV